MNNTLLIGRLTRDPEVRYTGEGLAIARLTLAVERDVKKEGKQSADFPSIVVFGKTAEACEKYLVKGRLVAVQGRLQTGSHDNKDGQKVYTTDVVADKVKFLEWGEKSDSDTVPKENLNEDGFEMISDDEIPF